MEQIIRKVDRAGRVVLPKEFRGKRVSITKVDTDEVTIRLVRSRPSLVKLLMGMTDQNRHGAK